MSKIKQVKEGEFKRSKAPCICGYEEVRKKTCKFCMNKEPTQSKE